MIRNKSILSGRFKNINSGNIRHEIRDIHEITQDLVLTSLADAAFFDQAVFHGGTALRFIYGLNRYYEGLDFSLLKKRTGEFRWEPYLTEISGMMAEYGCVFEVQDRLKTDAGSMERTLNFSWEHRQNNPQKIMIKVGMDMDPPDRGTVITQNQKKSGTGKIKTYDLPTLFAGKCHDLLCRGYEKGRDWYDLLWYGTKKIKPNYPHLAAALNHDGPYAGQDIKTDKGWLGVALKSHIDNLDFEKIKKDMVRFVEDKEYDDVIGWNKKLFYDLLLDA
jgi:hypothetical protein